MIFVGNPDSFALETCIAQAFASRAQLALGCFLVHIGGRRYGVDRPDASLLACSFDEVGRRLLNRGKHTAPFVQHAAAGELADAVYRAVYGPAEEDEPTLGLPASEIRHWTESNRLFWVPDGDQAFDDGSFLLQFDDGDRVRLVAFQVGDDRRHLPSTLSDLSLPADQFYDSLRIWQKRFESEWQTAPKQTLHGEINPSAS